MNAPWWLTILIAGISASGGWGAVLLRASYQRRKAAQATNDAVDAATSRNQQISGILVDKALEIANVAFAKIKDMEAEAQTTATQTTRQIADLCDRIKSLEDQVKSYEEEVEHLKADLYDCLHRQGRHRAAPAS